MGTGVHLLCMKHFRVTGTSRTVSAEPRVRAAPDFARLTALVLHLADELHAEELRNRQISVDMADEKTTTSHDRTGGYGEGTIRSAS